MRKIIKNAIQCKICGDVIESTYCHDYVECSCGACAVDGGHDYLRRCFKDKDCYIDLSVTEPDEASMLEWWRFDVKIYRTAKRILWQVKE